MKIRALRKEIDGYTVLIQGPGRQYLAFAEYNCRLCWCVVRGTNRPTRGKRLRAIAKLIKRELERWQAEDHASLKPDCPYVGRAGEIGP